MACASHWATPLRKASNACGSINCNTRLNVSWLGIPGNAIHFSIHFRRVLVTSSISVNVVAPESIATRAAALRAVAAETRRLALRRFLGRELCVIPERTRTGRCEGWSAEYLRCRLPESAPRGVPTAILPDGTLG